MDEASTGVRRGTSGCPHVNRNDPRCGSRFQLGRLEQAFAVCFGAFHGCPMYHRINHEQADTRTEPIAEVAVTIRGRGINVPLRATGT